MPTYEYRCPKCEYTNEVTHSINVEWEFFCPYCTETFMLKKPSAGLGVHFKGSGFYETDYKGK